MVRYVIPRIWANSLGFKNKQIERKGWAEKEGLRERGWERKMGAKEVWSLKQGQTEEHQDSPAERWYFKTIRLTWLGGSHRSLLCGFNLQVRGKGWVEDKEGLCLHTNSMTEPDVSLKGERAVWVEIRRGDATEKGGRKTQVKYCNNDAHIAFSLHDKKRTTYVCGWFEHFFALKIYFTQKLKMCCNFLTIMPFQTFRLFSSVENKIRSSSC